MLRQPLERVDFSLEYVFCHIAISKTFCRICSGQNPVVLASFDAKMTPNNVKWCQMTPNKAERRRVYDRPTSASESLLRSTDILRSFYNSKLYQVCISSRKHGFLAHFRPHLALFGVIFSIKSRQSSILIKIMVWQIWQSVFLIYMGLK